MPSVPVGTPNPRATPIDPARRAGPGPAPSRLRHRGGAHVCLLWRHTAARTRLWRHSRLPVGGRRLAADASSGLSALLRDRQHDLRRRRRRARTQPEHDICAGRRSGLRRAGLGGVGDHRVWPGWGLGRPAPGRLLHVLVAGHHRRGLHAARVAHLPRAGCRALVAPTAIASPPRRALRPLCAGIRQPPDDAAAGAGARRAHRRHARRPSTGVLGTWPGPRDRVRGPGRLSIRVERRLSLASCRPGAVTGRRPPHVLVRRHQVRLAFDNGHGRSRDRAEASRRSVLVRSAAAGWPDWHRPGAGRPGFPLAPMADPESYWSSRT